MESFRSAVQPRNGSSPPVNALQARSSFCSALQPRSGSSPPINWLPHRLRVFSAVQLRSGPSRPVSSLRFRKSACSAVHLRSGSSPPDSWLLNRSSTCSAGSLSSGNGPCSPQPSNRSERSAALHTAASPKIDAHVPFSFTSTTLSWSSEQPAPSSSGTTRFATAGASVVHRMSIERTRPCLACSTIAAVSLPLYSSPTRHGP